MDNSREKTLDTKPSQHVIFARNMIHFYRQWFRPGLDLPKFFQRMLKLVSFHQSWKRYRQSQSIPSFFTDTIPCLDDNTAQTSFDPHYLYQSVWAMELIDQKQPQNHIDVGSDLRFVSMLSVRVPVTFVDIRPMEDHQIKNLTSKAGSILDLPFEDNSLQSLSCLHVLEHIGLGRYGDPVDPDGTKKGCAQLERVLAKGGNLYISTPIGKERVCFNAHRIFNPKTIIDSFPTMQLAEFSAVDDNGQLTRNAKPDEFNSADYGCGLFHFVKG